MILSMGYQAQLFTVSVLLGIIVGFVYDIIRIVRRIICHNIMAIQAEDFFYWVVSGVFVFMALLRENYGEIRPFLIMGLFLGIIIYFAGISKAIMSVSMGVINVIKFIARIIVRMFMTVIEIILTPFFLLLKIFCKPVNFVKNKLKKFKKTNKKHLKNFKKCAKIYMYSLIRYLKIIFRKL